MAREGSLLRRRGSFERKNGRGATRKSRQKGRRLTARDCMKETFFFFNYLAYTILLGLTINENITYKLHMVLDLPRLATCGPRSKSSHNMRYFTNKIHQKFQQDSKLATSGLCSLSTTK